MDNEYILGPNGELYHWGIKGMKWGIRRYQNKDGSLTPAGKKHYKATEEELKAREKVIKNAERVRAKQAKIAAKKAELEKREAALKNAKKGRPEESPQKSMKDMTDDELRARVNRLQTEKQYRQLQAELYPKRESYMKRLGKKAMDEIVTPGIIKAGKNYVDKIIDRHFKEASPSIEQLLKKYGDMDQTERDRYRDAAAVKTWENTILGKKNK